ncbi:MAG: sulfate reduction electron transfer complex DsrMKJOP subunit DsrM [Desulfobacterales bacterium]
MNGKYLYSLLAVLVLFLLAYVGTEALRLQLLFGVIIPYAAVLVFIGGFFYRMMDWAKSPVPFQIPTTAGQQKSLPWIPYNSIDSPFTKGGVVLRMFLEVVTFRSLFRNTRMRFKENGRIAYDLEIWLWLFALVFHYAFLVVLLRHLRFFLEPVPLPVKMLEAVDTFIQIGHPVISMSSFVLLGAVIFLFIRRVYLPNMRYISLASDYFPLFLIIGIAFTGIFMRYFTKIDVTAAKELTYGLVSFHLPPSETLKAIGGVFYAHLFFVSILLFYFPFSKLMHMGGIFLSPTRNMPNNTRAVRHVNPWNYPVKVHTYQEYEDDFRDKMIEAGLPVDKKE